MQLRERAFASILGWFIAMVAALFVLAIANGPPVAMIVALVAYVVGGAVISAAFKCPKCKTPMFERSLYWRSPLPAKRCYVCGEDFTVN